MIIITFNNQKNNIYLIKNFKIIIKLKILKKVHHNLFLNVVELHLLLFNFIICLMLYLIYN